MEKVTGKVRGYVKKKIKREYNIFADESDLTSIIPELNKEELKNLMDIKVMVRIRPLLLNESNLSSIKPISNTVLIDST